MICIVSICSVQLWGSAFPWARLKSMAVGYRKTTSQRWSIIILLNRTAYIIFNAIELREMWKLHVKVMTWASITHYVDTWRAIWSKFLWNDRINHLLVKPGLEILLARNICLSLKWEQHVMLQSIYVANLDFRRHYLHLMVYCSTSCGSSRLENDFNRSNSLSSERVCVKLPVCSYWFTTTFW